MGGIYISRFYQRDLLYIIFLCTNNYGDPPFKKTSVFTL